MHAVVAAGSRSNDAVATAAAAFAAATAAAAAAAVVAAAVVAAAAAARLFFARSRAASLVAPFRRPLVADSSTRATVAVIKRSDSLPAASECSSCGRSFLSRRCFVAECVGRRRRRRDRRAPLLRRRRAALRLRALG